MHLVFKLHNMLMIMLFFPFIHLQIPNNLLQLDLGIKLQPLNLINLIILLIQLIPQLINLLLFLNKLLADGLVLSFDFMHLIADLDVFVLQLG